jgi:large subunit ribosomal protein L2
MPVKTYNPTSPGRRFQTTSTFEEVTRSTPEKSLVVKTSQSGGRNNRGKITVRYRGGWHKKNTGSSISGATRPVSRQR